MNEEINIEDKEQEMKEDGFKKLIEEYDRELEEQLEKKRLNSEKRKAKSLKKKMKEIELFREEIGEDSGSILSCATIDLIPKIHKYFTNKSDVLILRDSKLINHVIPSKNNRLVVVNVDYNFLKDEQNSSLINIQIMCCNKHLRYCNVFCNDYTNISYDSQRKSYKFKDLYNEIYIPALDNRDVDKYIHEIDFFNEIRMDIGDLYGDHTVAIILRFIDKKLPFDILIRKNEIIGFYQNEQMLKTSYVEKNKTVSCNDADLILRVYNFMTFNQKQGYGYNFSVIKNGDGQYWFLTQGNPDMKTGEYSINIYENIELIR